ncbi:MAG TPA: hypothetical protein VLV31_13555 [Candidatus Acidoferrales bacterium]|nr:hypothetical protein [Candidatus Acidoferrales bacterium]
MQNPIDTDSNGKANDQHQADFNALLIDSVDEAVSEVMGAKTSSLFWRHFQAYLGMTREEMPNDLPKLFTSLQTVFGSGDYTVGEMVIRKLYAKANVPLNFSHNHPLAECAQKLRQILARQETP